MKKLLLMVPALAIVATGCLNDRTYVDPESSTSQDFGAPNDLALRDGTVAGDFGPRQGFDGAATDMTGSSDRELKSSTASITRTENGRGTGMVILWTNGVLLEQLEVGTHEFGTDPSSLDVAALSVNVCSGAGDMSSIDYDAPAESGALVVTRTPEGRVYDVHTETATLDGMGNPTGQVDVANATFTLAN